MPMLFTWHLIGHMVSLDCDHSHWTHAILFGHGEPFGGDDGEPCGGDCDGSHLTHGEEDGDDKKP